MNFVNHEKTNEEIKSLVERAKKSDYILDDAVNHPSHYEGHTSLECCDVMKLTFGKYHYFYFCLGNAFKYLWRHKHKNGKEDVLKAKWYLDEAETIYEEGQGSSLFLDDKENLDNMKEVFDKAVYSYSEGEEEYGRGTV